VRAPLLVATDVDGTLLDPADRVTQRTLAVLDRAAAAGVGLVLVTGRPPRWISPVVAQVGMAGLAVCANGAVLYDAATDRVVSARTLDAATLADLAAIVSATLPRAGLAVELVHPVPSFVAEPSYRHAWVGSDHEIRPRAELVTQPAVKMLVRDTLMHSEEIVAALAPAVGSAVDLTFSHPGGLVEISARGVTKGVLGVGLVPEVALQVEDLRVGEELGVEIVGPEVRGGAEVGVQGALCVGGDDDQAAARGHAVVRGSGGVLDARSSQVVAEHCAELVLVHPADERGGAAERRHADHRARGRSPGHLGRRAHRRVEVVGPLGVDELHRAPVEAVRDDEVVGFVTEHVDEGVADPDDVEPRHATGRGAPPMVTGTP
jgi:hydroxymethylpyrimidine pyrophosphatase-like HAD family hydrolase